MKRTFKVRDREFVLFQGAILEEAKLFFASEEVFKPLGKVDENGEPQYSIDHAKLLEFAGQLIESTLIAEQLPDGTDKPVTQASFVSEDRISELIEFTIGAYGILRGLKVDLLKEINEKKTESKPTSKQEKELPKKKKDIMRLPKTQSVSK